MNEVIRLDVERYRRRLRMAADEGARRTIKQILNEFAAKFSSARPLCRRPRNVIHIKSKMFRQRMNYVR